MASLGEVNNVEVRCVYSAVGNPSYRWNNVYHIYLETPTSDLQAWSTFATGFASASIHMHHNAVRCERVVCSTYDAEGAYNPEQLFVEEVSYLGDRTVSGDILGRHVCLFIKREVGFGRSGKLFLRGCLAEGDVASSTALDWALIPGSLTSLQTLATTMYMSMRSCVQTLGGSGSGLRVFTGTPSPYSNVPEYSRTVTSLTVRGVVVNRPDHRYFDRA